MKKNIVLFTAWLLCLLMMPGITLATPRTFTDFKVEFRDNPCTILLPTSGVLPTGVTIADTIYNGSQHGVRGGKITVPVDGPVKFTIGACQYNNGVITVKRDGANFATIDNAGSCGEQKPNYNQFITWTYNEEQAATLVFEIAAWVYIPYFFAEACDYVAEVTVSYYNMNGQLIGEKKVDGNSKLAYAYGESDVIVPAGQAFRGWFESPDATATKVREGITLTENIALYARATEIEVATTESTFSYDFRQACFYPEDHDLMSVNGGKYKDSQHGWTFNNNESVSVDVAGNALVVVGVCTYSHTGTTVVKDAAGNKIGELTIQQGVTGDGSEQTIRYNGQATTLTLYFTATNYIHSIKVYNIESLPAKNEATGFYEIPAGDAKTFLYALLAAEAGDKIFLPDGLYDLGDAVLTQIGKNDLSIIGESMEGTIIRNAPDYDKEGIAVTATILIPMNIRNTYLQDLTLQNALDYYGALDAGQSNARAIALQDQGTQTICKNVRLLSHQDTYYSNLPGAVKYFDNCEIHGTVDFICGDGNVYFKNCLLYGEKRKTDGSGSDALTANNGPATDKGYVFVDCTIQSECLVVSLGRAWDYTPSVVFINSLVDYSAGDFAFADKKNSIQRWTKGLMNPHAWPKFGEYNTHLANGTVLTPAANTVTFIDTNVSPNESRDIETVLSAAQAATYTMDYTLGAWASTAANSILQETADPKAIDAAALYLVEDNGAFVAIKKGAELDIASLTGKTIRKANARGAFGAPAMISDTETGIEEISQEPIANSQKLIENGQLIILRDGVRYNAQGVEVR